MSSFVRIDTWASVYQDAHGMHNENKTVDTNNLPSPPDIRQSVCHTLMAAGFVFLNLLNPINSEESQSALHSWTITALVFVVFISWIFFTRRLRAWRAVPTEIRMRVTRRPQDLKQRAVSHLIMSLLAVLLTAFALYAGIEVPTDRFSETVNNTLLVTVSAVGVLAMAVLARTVRELITIRKLLI